MKAPDVPDWMLREFLNRSAEYEATTEPQMYYVQHIEGADWKKHPVNALDGVRADAVLRLSRAVGKAAKQGTLKGLHVKRIAKGRVEVAFVWRRT